MTMRRATAASGGRATEALTPAGLFLKAVDLATALLLEAVAQGIADDRKAGQPPHDEARAAYEQLQPLMGQEFEQAAGAFLQRYGLDTWDKETTLALRRKGKAQAPTKQGGG